MEPDVQPPAEKKNEGKKVATTEANNVRAISPVNSAARMQTENRRYVILSQVLLAAGIAWALANAFLLVWRGFNLPSWMPFGIHESTWAGVILAGAAFVYTIRNEPAQEFANEVAIELRKVTWPTWKETRQATIVVIIVVAIIAGILGTFDLIWAKLIKTILSWGTM